jgi:hypothetical protein
MAASKKKLNYDPQGIDIETGKTMAAVMQEREDEKIARAEIYSGLYTSLDFDRGGTRMLRGGIRSYSPCVLDKPGW